jgi:hypothetical protein
LQCFVPQQYGLSATTSGRLLGYRCPVESEEVVHGVGQGQLHADLALQIPVLRAVDSLNPK